METTNEIATYCSYPRRQRWLGLSSLGAAGARPQADPGQTSPLAQRDPGKESPLAQRDAGQTSPLAQAEDCTAMWKRADLNNDGTLAGNEVDKLRGVLNSLDTNKDGKISQTEFTTACQKGTLKNIQF
jgi:hypothetical protein